MPRAVRIPVRERILIYKYSVEQAMTPERIWELLVSSRERVVSLEYIRRQCALFDSDNVVLISDYLKGSRPPFMLDDADCETVQ